MIGSFGFVAALLLAVICSSAHAQLPVGSQCVTPDNLRGVCINIRQCQFMLNLLLSGVNDPAKVDYLRKSQCGFQGRDAVVCCPSNAGNGGNGNNYPNNPSFGNPNNPSFGNPNNPSFGNPNNPSFGNPNNPSFGNPSFGNPNNPSFGNPNNPSFGNPNNPFIPGGNGGNRNQQPGGGVGGAALLPEDCGRDLSNRIVGGEKTALDEFPWMVLLEYRKPNGIGASCGGVLINQRYVLTAGHCVQEGRFTRSWILSSVRIGEYDTTKAQDCIPDGAGGQTCAPPAQSVAIEEQIVHPDYTAPGASAPHDIALLRLARNVEFNDYVKPICLPKSADLKQRLVSAGWGKTEVSSKSDVKLKVTLPLLTDQDCHARYREYNVKLIPGQFCAGGKRGFDTCSGDSGGPLMQQNLQPDGTQRWTSVGVVSFGPNHCGSEGLTGVYTRVYDYMPWILRNLRP